MPTLPALTPPALAPAIGDWLCTIDFEVRDGVFAIGRSPFGDQRMGYITGGSFAGPRMRGEVLPGGGNWSRGGRLGADASVGTFDARAVLKTHDGALIYVTYGGRSVIPDDVRAEFGDPAKADLVDPSRYYLRIAPVFETAHPDYQWLNGVLAVGHGERIDGGARQKLFAII